LPSAPDWTGSWLLPRTEGVRVLSAALRGGEVRPFPRASSVSGHATRVRLWVGCRAFTPAKRVRAPHARPFRRRSTAGRGAVNSVMAVRICPPKHMEEPAWLRKLRRTCAVVHLVGGACLISMPRPVRSRHGARHARVARIGSSTGPTNRGMPVRFWPRVLAFGPKL
jgi:hypothetical protein